VTEALDSTPKLPYERRMRLVRKGDFDRAFREGSRARGAIVLVVARPNGLDVTRLGLSVGKSIWKSAVKRNKIRRVFRESFRTSYPDLPRGMDLVLIPGAPKLVPEFEATRAELVRMAHKATRRCEERAAQIAAAGPGQAVDGGAQRADARPERKKREKRTGSKGGRSKAGQSNSGASKRGATKDRASKNTRSKNARSKNAQPDAPQAASDARPATDAPREETP